MHVLNERKANVADIVLQQSCGEVLSFVREVVGKVGTICFKRCGWRWKRKLPGGIVSISLNIRKPFISICLPYCADIKTKDMAIFCSNTP